MKSGPTTHGKTSETSAPKHRAFQLGTLPPTSAATVGHLSELDERLALSVVTEKQSKTGRRRRCGTCGLLFPPQDVRSELDEDGRRTGWTCYGCE